MAAMVSSVDTVLNLEGQAENDRDEEDALKASKRKISLSNCHMCGSEEAKYRCPACLKYSCSLPCVKKHKEASGCSGVRDKTAFVALSQFEEINLLSDYRFLEDTGRFADSTTRDNLVHIPRVTFKAKKFAAHARKINITLRFLPVTFSRSKENSTIFRTKENQFHWHLKLIFPQSNTEFSVRRVPDHQTLEQILTPYIHPTESDPVWRQKLKRYVLAPFDHVKVFMKAEGRKANSVRYHEMDRGKSLRDSLSYKTLIEYPVLHVVLRDHFQEYPLKGPVGSASACNSLTTTMQAEDPGRKESAELPPAQQGSLTPGGTTLSARSQEISPETESPSKKRARREAGEMPEEGEIMDISGDEEEPKEGNNESCTGGDETETDIQSPVKVPEHKLADSVAEDAGKSSTATAVGDQCTNKAENGSAVTSMASTQY